MRDKRLQDVGVADVLRAGCIAAPSDARLPVPGPEISLLLTRFLSKLQTYQLAGPSGHAALRPLSNPRQEKKSVLKFQRTPIDRHKRYAVGDEIYHVLP